MQAARVRPVGISQVEAVCSQVGDRGAETWQGAALHAPAVRRQPALQCEAAQVLQARQRGGVEHHILNCRVQHQLQADAARQLV